jgi:hypothetical protein
MDDIGETFVPICWTASKSTICFWTELFKVTRLPFTCQGRWIVITQSSGDHRIHSKLSKYTGRCIGRGGCIPWPHRSPNLTPIDFSFWEFVKDNVYIPPMPVDLREIRDRIVNTIALVDAIFLDKLWDKLEYRLDVCRITRGSHIEHL